MVVDAHFARIVLLAKADAAALASGDTLPREASAIRSTGIKRLLMDVSALIKTQVEVCDSAADLRGHLAHILQRQPLPQPPEPDYVVDILTL